MPLLGTSHATLSFEAGNIFQFKQVTGGTKKYVIEMDTVDVLHTHPNATNVGYVSPGTHYFSNETGGTPTLTVDPSGTNPSLLSSTEKIEVSGTSKVTVDTSGTDPNILSSTQNMTVGDLTGNYVEMLPTTDGRYEMRFHIPGTTAVNGDKEVYLHAYPDGSQSIVRADNFYVGDRNNPGNGTFVLGDCILQLRSPGLSERHTIRYTNSYAGVSTDGPTIIGYAGVAIGRNTAVYNPSNPTAGQTILMNIQDTGITNYRDVTGKHMYVLADATYDLGAPSAALNNIYTVNAVTVTSDVRYKNIKRNITPFMGMSIIDSLDPILYTLKDTKEEEPKVRAGITAQALHKAKNRICPEWDSAIDVPEDEDEDKWRLRYMEIIPFLIASVQQLSATCKRQQYQIDQLLQSRNQNSQKRNRSSRSMSPPNQDKKKKKKQKTSNSQNL